MTIKDGELELAEFLFDGDKVKAEKLLLLIRGISSPITPPEFKNLVMNLPEETCKWCSSGGDCLFRMPDSMFHCKGKCEEYEEKA